MRSIEMDLLATASSKSLTYQQKLFSMANVAERLIDPREVLNYSDIEMQYLENDMICDLNEGYLPYRPRYIVPDYSVFVEQGCKFLDLPKPSDMDDLLDGLMIIYNHVPSITSFPVYIGNLDQLIEPFLSENTREDYKKIKRFLNHIDKTIVDSFCHANIGPEDSIAGRLIIDAIIELQNPTPNVTLNYDFEKTSDDFAKYAAKACLLASKPSFSHVSKYNEDVGEHAIVSCYNALPKAGGAYTLLRLRLGTIVKNVKNLDDYLVKLNDVSIAMAGMMDKRVKYMINESNFFETSFLVDEGYISKDNFTAMFGIVGLADAVNYILKLEDIDETFGQSLRGDEIAHKILSSLDAFLDSHEVLELKRTNQRYLFHAQVGASLSNEDMNNTPAHRIKVGQEPSLPEHIKQSAQFHKYFKSGTGDLFAFDQTYVDRLDSLLDIIKGSFNEGYRYITTYMQNSDLIRVTGYLVKKSEVEKADHDKVVLRDTAMFGSGTNDNANVFGRRVRK